MKCEIIILGDEKNLDLLAGAINRKYCEAKADIKKHNDEKIGECAKNDRLFFVGHANILKIGGYGFDDLVIHFKDHMTNASAIFLAGCSSDDSSQQILKNGFIAATLARNVKTKYADKTVYGTPGPLVLNTQTDELYVEVPLSSGYKKSDVWVEQKKS